MELWFARKSLASSLCVEAILLTQIFDTSSQLRLGECSTSCHLHHCGLLVARRSTISTLHSSPARDVLPVCVSVRRRGAQPSRTDALC
jgi:hypothetical protein